MKRNIIFATILILMFGSLPALATDRNAKRIIWREKNPNLFSVNIGISGYPKIAYSSYDNAYGHYGPVSYLYSDYRGKTMTTGAFGGEFNWNISRWFNASGYLGFCPIWNDVYSGVTNEKLGTNTGVAIYIMPKAKVMWCNSPLVRVYSSLSLGVALLPGFNNKDSFVKPAIQFNLAGVEIGRKWFGFFEIGGGSVFVGGKVGFGYKF